MLLLRFVDHESPPLISAVANVATARRAYRSMSGTGCPAAAMQAGFDSTAMRINAIEGQRRSVRCGQAVEDVVLDGGDNSKEPV